MRVLILTAMYPSPENPTFGTFVHAQVTALRRAGVDLDLLVLSGRPRKLIYPKGVFELRRRLARGDIDLVHAHFSYAGVVARTQSQVPVVVTYHGDDLLGTVAPNGEREVWSDAVVMMGRILGQLVDAVIVQSRQMARQLWRRDAHIIPHEVDFDVFRPTPIDGARRELGLASDKKYLLFAANPAIPVKRFSLARQAADLLIARDASVELLTVYQESQPQLALYMSACDALVFPSYQEGSPNIVKQAMACNLPIVATDVGDVRDVIGQTEGCFICPPDPAVFAERLDDVLRSGRRTEGRQHVQHLAPALVAGRIIQVYEQVLRRRLAPVAHPRRVT